jgi:hypothetical protein
VQREFRRRLVGCVLATDMSRHHEVTDALRRRLPPPPLPAAAASAGGGAAIEAAVGQARE